MPAVDSLRDAASRSARARFRLSAALTLIRPTSSGAAEPCKHAVDQAREVLLIQREPHIALETALNRGQIGGIGLVEQDPRRDVVHCLRRASAVGAAAKLALISEYWQLLHQAPQRLRPLGAPVRRGYISKPMAPSLMDEQLLDAIVGILRRCGLNAGWQQSGGGIHCLIVSGADEDEPRFWFGRAGDRWAAEVDGDPAGLWTDIDSDEDNPTQIARGILAAITRFSQNQS